MSYLGHFDFDDEDFLYDSQAKPICKCCKKSYTVLSGGYEYYPYGEGYVRVFEDYAFERNCDCTGEDLWPLIENLEEISSINAYDLAELAEAFWYDFGLILRIQISHIIQASIQLEMPFLEMLTHVENGHSLPVFVEILHVAISDNFKNLGLGLKIFALSEVHLATASSSY